MAVSFNGGFLTFKIILFDIAKNFSELNIGNEKIFRLNVKRLKMRLFEFHKFLK